uniref:hypothetical protein n=1 Tax=Candidatus Wunengus sp. YC63 TaxID=3367699 RepID=UPI004025D3B2
MKCKTMVRPVRIEFEGAFYYITSRGSQRDRIFLKISMIQMRDCSNKKTIYNEGLNI